MHFAVSDANWGSIGDCEGHLRAAVVVEFAHAGAAYHPAVGVRSSVCVPIPEAPDVALWAYKPYRVVAGTLNLQT